MLTRERRFRSCAAKYWPRQCNHQFNEKPRLAAGFQLSETQLHFQLAPDHAAESDQTRSEQAQRTRLRNDDVGVATRDAGASVKESLAGVYGQLNRRALAGAGSGHQG